jgi:hypothetical protein
MLINQLVFLTLSLINPALSASNNRQRPFLVEKFGDSIPFDLQPRLIRTSENGEAKWLNPIDIIDLRINNIKFMDVTDEGDVNFLKNNQFKAQDFRKCIIYSFFFSILRICFRNSRSCQVQ